MILLIEKEYNTYFHLNKKWIIYMFQVYENIIYGLFNLEIMKKQTILKQFIRVIYMTTIY